MRIAPIPPHPGQTPRPAPNARFLQSGCVRRLRGSVLPTVVAVSVVMLTALLGLVTLWEQETLLFARGQRLRQARADVESAYMLYRLHPDDESLTAPEGYLLYDSLPRSRVFVRPEPWGLYEAVRVRTADSLLHVCRLFGAEPEPEKTLYYADNRSAVTLAGRTRLQGTLHLPQNGLIYGRVGSDFYRGAQIPRTAIRRAVAALPQPEPEVLRRVAALFAEPMQASEPFPDSVFRSFVRDSAAVLRLGDAEIGDCSLRGRIILCGDELCIDSTCRMEHLLVAARKITVGSGARITAQLFARDTLVVEARAELEYPSGIYAGQYAELGEGAEVNGYVIVRDTVVRKKVSASYRQSRTARVRGLVWVDGVAQVRGIVAGRTAVRQAVWFSPQGYYKDMLYDVTLLENPVTARPLWLPALRRKEAACVE